MVTGACGIFTLCINFWLAVADLLVCWNALGHTGPGETCADLVDLQPGPV